MDGGVPLSLVIALVGAIGTGIGVLYRAVIKGDLVPGVLYRAMEQRAITAEIQQERNAETLRETVAVVKASRELTGGADAPK